MKVRDVIRLVEKDGWFLERTSPTICLAEQRFETGRTKEEMKYSVIYDKAATGYGAYVPDLPGCVARGKTKAQVRKSIRAAVELHIESLKLHGKPVPEPTTGADSITVSA